MLGHRRPALVVEAAVVGELEVLHGVAVLGIGVVEAVGHADALDGCLGDAVDHRRLGHPGGLQQDRGDVDDVVELVAGLTLGGDPVGPVDDGGVAGPAPVGGDLLGPLIRGTQGMRPADRIVVVGRRPAQLVDPLAQELRGLQRGHAVEVDHLVEGPLEGASALAPLSPTIT